MKYVHFSVNSIFIIVHVLHQVQAKQFYLIATMVVFRSVSDKKYLLPCTGVAKIDHSLQILVPHCIPRTPGLNLSTPYCGNCHHVTSSVYYLGLKWRVRIASGEMKISINQTWIGPESIFLSKRTPPMSHAKLSTVFLIKSYSPLSAPY